MQSMSLFDLLFIVLFLISVVTLLTAAIAAIRGRRAAAILRVWAICLAIYLTVVAVVALSTPQRVYAVGEDRCFDDWCIAVEAADRSPAPQGILYTVTLRVSSRARRVTQREKGASVYLTDDRGRRFDAVPDPSATPLDVPLEPGQAARAKRTLLVPADAHEVGLAFFHEGSSCFPGCFIVGEDSNPLHKHAVVRLP
jgi:hypothetical protein